MAAELPHVLPEVASLGLAETYDELGRLSALDRSLFPSSAEKKPAEDSGFLPWGPGPETLNAESDEKEVFVAPDALLTANSNAVAIETRRHAQQERAMDLFPDKIQPLNLLDLPIDILRDVVDYFREDWNDPKPQRRETLQSLRLACRLLSELVAPICFRTLRVQLSVESLERFEKLSNNPVIAEAVRGVQVVLAYRPAEIAADLVLFKDQRCNDLDKYGRACEYHCEFLEAALADPYLQAMDVYDDICFAWNHYLNPDEHDEAQLGDNGRAYQTILCEGFDAYRRLHEEQRHLVADRTFVRRVADALARMPRALNVLFVDETEHEYVPSKPAELLLDPRQIAALMRRPQPWMDTESRPGGEEERTVERLAPVRILAELPLAACEAGAALREIHIGCSPLVSNFHLLAPGGESGWGWEDLRAACRELEVFTFAQRRVSTGFFATMLESSRALELVHLVLRPLGMNYDGGVQRDDGWYRFDGALRPSVEWRRLRHFTFMYVELHQEDLDIVCGALGENLDWVYLCHVWLMSGSWAGALDALHDRVSERARRGLCKVILTSLRGAEFEEGGGTGLVKLAESYLKGTIEENPLRKSSVCVRLRSAA
ncbi:hypothetical protein B0H14DRAFT_3862550 [Mycena olivaceomarginata]|nr:hypothetical protein B0H14DRAFT_3862550 [Mycena olivaceomarginata]